MSPEHRQTQEAPATNVWLCVPLLHFNVPTCPLWARMHDRDAEPSWVIQAPVVSQLRWNNTSFARLESRLYTANSFSLQMFAALRESRYP